MPSLRVTTGVALAILAGAVAVAPAAMPSGSSSAPAAAYAAPVAHASGGSAGPPTYPSIVNVRLVRAQAALDRATALVDENQSAAASVELAAAVTNMNDAWAAATYVIETAPPPVAGDGAFAHVGGSGGGGLAFASPEETGFAVLTLQHTVVTTAIGLADTIDPDQALGVRSTVLAALRARDAAVDYIHSIPVPVAGAGGLHATTSGGAIVAGWGMLMPGMIPLLDDEIQEIKGTRVINSTLPSLTLLRLARWKLRIIGQEDTINKYWPPVPADG